MNLIVIGVGQLPNEAQIRNMTNSSEKGMYIPAAAAASGISEAFGKAATAFSAGQVTMEAL